MDWIRMKKAFCDKCGSSLPEVMAAFVLLMLLLAMLAAGLDVSGRMLVKSRQMRQQLASVRRACFLGAGEAAVQEAELELVPRDGGAVISVEAVLRTYSDGAATLYEVAPAGGEEELWNDLWEEKK